MKRFIVKTLAALGVAAVLSLALAAPAQAGVSWTSPPADGVVSGLDASTCC